MDKGWVIENRNEFTQVASIELFGSIISKVMEENLSNDAITDIVEEELE